MSNDSTRRRACAVVVGARLRAGGDDPARARPLPRAVTAALSVLAVLALWPTASAAAAACPTSEPALQALIAGQGTVNLSCPSATTISISSTIGVSDGQSVALDASGSPGRVTLDGGGAVEVFSVSGGGLTLKGLTLAHGQGNGTSAGAIENNGTLAVVNSTLAGNKSVGGRGGAIANAGTATVTGSTLVGNTSALGGAILNTGTLSIAASTLSGNDAFEGGALYNGGEATITNSTLAANRAGTAGAAIFSSAGGVSIAATIVAGSGPSSCAGQAPTDRGYNLEDDAGGSCAFTAAQHDVVGEDPQLGPLADNGGPTQTLAVPFASPATDRIPTSSGLCPSTDQRGQPRPDRGESACDIGAYENQSENACPTNESQLNELINSQGPLTVSCPNPTKIAITVPVTVTKNITIDASASAGPITLQGAGSSRLFVNFGALKLIGVTLSGGSASAGGAIYNEGSGTLTIADSTLTGNSAAGAGGAIWSGGTLIITASLLAGNTAGTRGGALATGPSGRTSIADSTLTANNAGDGAAVANGNPLTISNSTVAANTAGAGGSAISSAGRLTASATVFAHNKPASCAITGPFTDRGYNLEDDPNDSCNLSLSTDILGQDPKLGPLANNGGPTQTLALLPGSPAIDRIPLTSGLCPATDQRGSPRPGAPGTSCDIGAYEASSAGLAAPPPAQLTAISCMSTFMVTRHERVRTRTAKCTVGSTPSPRTIGSRLAIITRNGREFATGTATVPRGGGFQLTVTELRPLRHGQYTLTVRSRRRHQTIVQRQTIIIGVTHRRS